MRPKPTRMSANLRTSAGRAPPRRVPADEARQLVLRAGVVGNRDSGTELAARSHRVLERCRAGDDGLASGRVEIGLDTESPGQVPCMHENISGVELVDRRGQWNLTDVPVAHHPVAWILQQ